MWYGVHFGLLYGSLSWSAMLHLRVFELLQTATQIILGGSWLKSTGNLGRCYLFCIDDGGTGGRGLFPDVCSFCCPCHSAAIIANKRCF